ncbi:MAG: APC family permease [Acidiphilium sp.]|nr:APC family permease [Acidiphilium sp.]MDD4936199.1 APC family permease [Acidiphilium sp.]
MSELRKNNLSFIEAIGQSITSLSPTFTPALGVAVVGGMAGSASWLVYTLATVGIVIVALNIAKLAKRIPAAGSFFLYVSRTLGPSYGLLSGWAMLVAYLFTSVALTVATSLFFKALIAGLGITIIIPNVVIYVVVSALIWLLAYRDIKFSTRFGLSLEGLSVAAILIVCFLVWKKFGFEIDPKQVHLSGASFGSIAPPIVFAIFSWVGFESAATLSKEIRNPEVVVPRAIVATAIIVGIFFIGTTAIVVMGFGDNATKLGASAAPLNYISEGLGSWVALFIYFAAMISCFACSLGQLNAFSRMLFSLGRYQFVHKSMGVVHKQHHTPHLALAVGTIANAILCIVFSEQGETNLVGYFGTIATFGFITVYFLCSICAPILLYREKTLKAGDVILGAAGAIAMALAFFGSVYPVPAAPYNYFPWGFIVYMAIGIVWFFVLKAKSPNVLLGIEHDLEGLGTAAD